MHSWDDFRYFLAVADHGSFSVASQKLGVNHSTVSRRIQSLEERHGVRLFERTRNGYAMTDAGAAIYEIIESVRDDTLKASRVLLGQDARLEGKIKLTMPHDLFKSCMVQHLQHYCQAHPAIDLHLSVTPGLRDLANREADLAVRFTPKPPDYLVGKCITPMQHGLYAHTQLDCSRGTPIIIWGGDDGIPQWAHDHFTQPLFGLRVDDLASMHAAVAAGFGVARMPCFYADAVQEASVVRLPIEQALSTWGVWLLNHVDLRNTARINHCKAFLNEKLTEIIPLFRGQHSVYGALPAQ
ncbi:LysR family transcriptional regulator [Halioxenophilus sp. WMMB6]|uniref:LysR family transcriptional regulator n=1 Tax=Halioxenophilus sp. WMMB6 TaxID=3073815 RepID=UPI00295F48D6|nr:LysR family transcriptional regulator [Halioxenophilus sp. WMMB6]